ncbi:MAG: prolyl oligopeptidase family serine peptidase [SAR202 cluster bacterium]|jgi:dienelactone hydrolase|nr:prolyl oligopeptidase family serine peptidase [SAR202 cluster bacterium]MDP6302179.1 prolyl oligopeptidase family serine peptidase [SAR202 cluster bacterium]MDP7104189.1 prolyl oligopeptidase family serine peptidase [SAR202 cluster bacterium]HJO80988.1 prolyl oligopeptidase family serine peptidase [SAR202 cluster bacterium]
MASKTGRSPGLDYFPGNYRWSAALRMAISSAKNGGAELGEVDVVGQRLASADGDDEAWFREWRAMAGHVRGLALDAETAGHNLTAAGAYLRAVTYYQVGERFRTPKDADALDAYRASVDGFRRYSELIDRPRIEIVEVPFEGGNLPAYFLPAENTNLERPPCVVFFDGLDVTKEILYIRGADLARRGVACLLVDGPGTGEAIRFRGLPLRYDYEVAGSAALDYLERRPDVDSDRVGVLALSLGGYYAPRCASLEKRFKACVAWGAIWDYHATWKRRIDAAFQTALSVPGHHISWALGVDTLEQSLAKLEDFRLDGIVQQMECPFLLTHGELDAQIPMEDAQALYDAVGSSDKTFKVFTAEEGGHQHCQCDNQTIGTTYIFDWFHDKL